MMNMKEMQEYLKDELKIELGKMMQGGRKQVFLFVYVDERHGI